MLLILDFSMIKNFQCHIFERTLIVKTCLSIVTADFISLEECCLVLIANLRSRKMQRDSRDEFSSEFQYKINQN